MNQATLPFDITARKHRGDAMSAAANRKIHHSKESAREFICKLVESAGYFGMTSDEIAAELDVSVNRISGRLSELKALGPIIATDRTRKTRAGCNARVLIARRQV